VAVVLCLFCVIVYFVIDANFVVVFVTKPRYWLGRMSPK